ncbi:MAG TPA: hypothetical protein VLZ74_15060 [Methylocella sp.]|nr:hypothetical protein [Methylocella sp.]
MLIEFLEALRVAPDSVERVGEDVVINAAEAEAALRALEPLAHRVLVAAAGFIRRIF